MTPVPLTADEESRAWRSLVGSPAQMVLHNRLLQRIEETRTRLETVQHGELSELQGCLKELRRTLAELHKHDPPPVKEVYG